LLAVVEPVCKEHARQVREQIASGAKLSEEGAKDDLDVVLRAIGNTFHDEGGTDALSLIGPAHAAAREGQGFTVPEILGEYVLLRRNLQTQVLARLGRDFTAVEREAFQSSMDGLVALVVSSVTNQREGRLRLETDALGDFLSSLAHDLRNDINGVMTSMTLLEETGRDLQSHRGSLPPTKSAELEDGGRLDNLLRDVTACRESMVSTVTAMTRLLDAESLRNRISSSPKDSALRPLMEGIARSADRLEHPSAQSKNTASRIEVICPNQILLWTDPDLLTTVLTNLIGNAVKYAPRGPIRFTAEFQEKHCRIAVADEGPGMTPEQVARLFTKYERVGRRDGRGMGLGLYVAKRAADLLGAKIFVESKVGAGSCFTVELARDLPLSS
jgi:signal transduction histidine kinase